jgi:hypothetical protein
MEIALVVKFYKNHLKPRLSIVHGYVNLAIGSNLPVVLDNCVTDSYPIIILGGGAHDRE